MERRRLLKKLSPVLALSTSTFLKIDFSGADALEQ
jgi:hypothetical protein